MYNNIDELIKELENYDALTVEVEDINIDMKTGIARINKDAFDCFMENYYINIYCPDIDANYIMQFIMKSENDEEIVMEWIDSISV